MASSSTPASRKLSGLGFALLSALAFGGSGPFARPLMDAGVDPLQVTWLRLLGMALLMLPVAWYYRSLLRTQWKLLLAYGIFPIAGVQAFYFAAIARIPVGIALLIEFLGPVLVLLWVGLIRRQPVARSAMLGVALAVLGLGGLLEVWKGLVLDPLGLLLAGLAAACQAGFFLLSDAASDDVEPIALIAIGGCVAFVIMTVIAQPWTLPWSVLGGEITIAGRQAPAMVSVLWLGLIATALAYWTGVAAIRRLSPPVAGGVAYLEVVTAIVLAWLLLNETLTMVQFAGAAVVVLGAWLAQRATPEAPDNPELALHSPEPTVDR
ncbi:EamA family transporter [Natronospirillum operosum]|uniref:EamA family transporter n=1 Tax=Natronospirillum operosum TaxID=2759953 RepID=A0A4Z0WDJ0_9GAMM|nr:EamA family transporter [Natronospirillum operosum]TGG93206.1 EamA family transporter [Natronospirillum operosum]